MWKFVVPAKVSSYTTSHTVYSDYTGGPNACSCSLYDSIRVHSAVQVETCKRDRVSCQYELSVVADSELDCILPRRLPNLPSTSRIL